MRLILFLILIIGLIILGGFNLPDKNSLENEFIEETSFDYCETYANLLQVSSRIAYEGGEKQYYLNESWINESLLEENCLK